MVIVGGTFRVDPEQREAFLAARSESMRTSRAEPGCVEYVFAADPLEPDRVVLFERWASQEDLDVHLSAQRARQDARPGGVQATSASITAYDVSGERSLMG